MLDCYGQLVFEMLVLKSLATEVKKPKQKLYEVKNASQIRIKVGVKDLRS